MGIQQGKQASATDYVRHRLFKGTQAAMSPISKSENVTAPTSPRIVKKRSTVEVVSTGCGCRDVYRAGVRRIRNNTTNNNTGKSLPTIITTPAFSPARGDQFLWEEDDEGWNVIAGKACPPGSPATSPETIKKRLSTSTSKPKKWNRRLSDYYCEDEEDESTLFSSRRSMSSESSVESRTPRTRRRSFTCQRRPKISSLSTSLPYERLRTNTQSKGFSCMSPFRKADVEESVAVVKSSDDPYEDFKVSMVEMILEKRIFDVGDLQKLLGCFLSLNSPHHHTVIFHAFSEVCTAIFAPPSPSPPRRSHHRR